MIKINKPIKIFSDYRHYNKAERSELSSFLRPYWKDIVFSESERLTMYGIGEKDFVVINDIKDCDIVIIPMSWNYYKKNNLEHLAQSLIVESKKYNKKIVMHTSGDSGIRIPFDTIYFLRAGGYRSKRKEMEYVQPVFFPDPIKEIFNLEKIIPLKKDIEPIVGFCGQAEIKIYREVGRFFILLFKNIFKTIKVFDEDKEKLHSPTYIRSNVLKQIIKTEGIKTNFIIRGKYRAGAVNDKERLKTTKEFYQNMVDSHYNVCIRGGGNFSKRFYETMAMGRIPLFIDTDCNLPFQEEIDWNKCILWVASTNIKSIGNKIISNYNINSNEMLIELQMKCRKIWEEWLSFPGFHKKMAEKILSI